VPDDKTISRIGRQLGPAVVEKLHRRVVTIAQEQKVIMGRKMRVEDVLQKQFRQRSAPVAPSGLGGLQSEGLMDEQNLPSHVPLR
jgi:hypothetical protein